jgi:Zn-dependent peptidase ImmA (M78 family)
MKVRYNLVDKIITKLSSKHPELQKAPVKLEKIVKRLGIDLVEKDFDHTMSGAAIIGAAKKIISINKNESPVRKRFTTAHELGHILLHYDQELTVDLKPIRLNRDSNSATGESWREVEANYFAASILMPSDLVEKYYTVFTAQYDDDDEVLSRLAKKFAVSVQAMSIRLAKLELFKF